MNEKEIEDFEEEGVGYLWFTVYCLLLIGWEKLRLNMMIGRVFWK